MRPDGSDIIRLSYHETHEWHPSVTNDGMLVYTRGITSIGIRILRITSGPAFPMVATRGRRTEIILQQRETRPWMEMDIRAIPNSRQVCRGDRRTSRSRFGSLVLIDPAVDDDLSMSQLTRLTPDALFPEAEGGKENMKKWSQYGTPWPLSEDDYLCVYDAAAANRGIYLIDRFGNRQLLYRDPEIPCVNPIPLRPRPVPPVIPGGMVQTAEARESNPEPPGRRSVWPTCTTAILNGRREGSRGAARHSGAAEDDPAAERAADRRGRTDQCGAVLGTVPVEADGSAYFEAPVGKEIYFQALDEQGLAIQSMRSGTYVHPGEQLSCRGCHEPRREGPRNEIAPGAARAPSTIVPDVDGSNPFNYVRWCRTC